MIFGGSEATQKQNCRLPIYMDSTVYNDSGPLDNHSKTPQNTVHILRCVL